MNGKIQFHQFASYLVAFAVLLSAMQPVIVSAQSGAGLKREVNAESGQVSSIDRENGHPLSISSIG